MGPAAAGHPIGPGPALTPHGVAQYSWGSLCPLWGAAPAVTSVGILWEVKV